MLTSKSREKANPQPSVRRCGTDDSLSKAALRGLSSNYIGFALRSLATFCVQVVLARLLGPKPFGQMAIASLVMGLATQIADGGFSSALIQAETLTTRDIEIVCTLQMSVGFIMTLALALLANSVGQAFRDTGVAHVLRALSPIFLIQSFGLTSLGLLRRKMAFRTVQRAQIASYLVGYSIVGLSAAALRCGVWSLIAAQLTQALCFSGLLYYAERHSFRATIALRSLSLARFGAQVTTANLLNWSISNIDNAVVGTSLGSVSLGLYSRAFNLASTPTDGLLSSCQQVLFATCSRVQGRLERIRHAYLIGTSAVAFLMFPSLWATAACSGTVTLGLFGPQWEAAAPIVAPLSIAMSMHALMALAGPILAATGHIAVDLRSQLITLLLAGGALAFASQYSPQRVAWAVLAIYTFRYVVTSLPVFRILSITFSDLARALAGPVATAIVSASVLLAINLHLPSAVGATSRLVLLVVIGAFEVLVIMKTFHHLLLSPECKSILRDISTGDESTVIVRIVRHLTGGRYSRRGTLVPRESPRSKLADTQGCAGGFEQRCR